MSSATRPSRLRGPWPLCLGVGALLVAVGLALLLTRDSPARAKAVPIVNVGAVPSTTLSNSPSTRAAPQTGHALAADARLMLGRLGVDAPVERVSLQGNVMDVPRDPREVGWWSGGAEPGSSQGSVVIVGHINYAGTSGALGVLPDARPGDVVSLVEGVHALRYRIVAVRSYAKTRGIPADVFSRTGSPRLVLITCGGPFDPRTGNYEDNIVGYAQPL